MPKIMYSNERVSKIEGWCTVGARILPDIGLSYRILEISDIFNIVLRIKSPTPTLNAQIIVANIAVYLEKLLTC